VELQQNLISGKRLLKKLNKSMYHFGFLFVLVLSLGLVGYIIVSKFPQLRSLDVNSLPQEKEFRKKREIIDKRISEKGEKLKGKFEKYLKPLSKVWGKFQLKFRIYVGDIKRMMHHEEELKKEGEDQVVDEKDNPDTTLTRVSGYGASNEMREEKIEVKKKNISNVIKKVVSRDKEKVTVKDKINALLQEAEKDFQMQNYEKAEEKFIQVIKLDQTNPASYRGLADTYLALNSVEEARQTYKFVLKLEPDDDSVMVKMAEIADSQGDIEEAIEYYQKAVIVNDALAPRFYHLARLLHQIEQGKTAREAILQAVELDAGNLEYLDLLLQIAISVVDKNLAQDSYNELRALDSENKNLDSYKEKIEAMMIEE